MLKAQLWHLNILIQLYMKHTAFRRPEPGFLLAFLYGGGYVGQGDTSSNSYP
jgi:hypothetical protein